MPPTVVRTLPLPSLSGIFRRSEVAKIYPQAGRPVSSILKGWGCERSAGFSTSIIRRSLVGWSKLPKYSRQAHHRPKSAFIEIDELCTFITKKISILALASGGLHLWQGPRLCLVEEGTIKTGKILWQQIKHLLTMGYGTDLLSPTRISFHTPSITERPSPHTSNHSTAD